MAFRYKGNICIGMVSRRFWLLSKLVAVIYGYCVMVRSSIKDHKDHKHFSPYLYSSNHSCHFFTQIPLLLSHFSLRDFVLLDIRVFLVILGGSNTTSFVPHAFLLALIIACNFSILLSFPYLTKACLDSHFLELDLIQSPY